MITMNAFIEREPCVACDNGLMHVLLNGFFNVSYYYPCPVCLGSGEMLVLDKE